MFSVAALLFKTVVRKFYERNTGFFLFIFFLMFGIVESTQIVNYHLSLMYGMLHSVIFLSCVCAAWLFYMMKCVAFVSGYSDLPENSFLYKLNLLSYRRRLIWLLFIFTLIDLPVLVYSSLIVAVGIKEGAYGAVLSIISFHVVVLVGASLLLAAKLNSLRPSRLRFPRLRFNRPLPLPLFYISALFHRYKIGVLLTKGFSFFAIIGFLHIPLDHYEYRTALMGILFGVAAHLVLVFEFRKMEENNLMFLRGLPITLMHRFLQLAAVYALIMIPELALLIVNHTPLHIAAGIYLFSIGLLLLSHSRLFIELDNDKHVQYMLGLFLISFMLVLFKVYLLELVAVWALAFYYFRTYFYRFERMPL
ncbi:MAG: hypothetical protein JSS79_20805 [Bacteroidetes bacterium]|nr:hypothetical protein [Bacteroidota bacterium]